MTMGSLACFTISPGLVHPSNGHTPQISCAKSQQRLCLVLDSAQLTIQEDFICYTLCSRKLVTAPSMTKFISSLFCQLMITFCLITFPLVSTAVSDFSDIILPTKLAVFVQCRPVTRPQLPLPLKSKVLTEPTWHLCPQPDMPREIWESFQQCQVTVGSGTQLETGPGFLHLDYK